MGEKTAQALDMSLDIENEHSPAYELWHIRKAVETSHGSKLRGLGFLHLSCKASVPPPSS